MPSKPSSYSKRWIIISVALISMVGPFSIDTYLPAFPSIEADLAVNRTLLSQTLAIYLASFAVMTLIWGPLSDRFGRKPVMYWSAPQNVDTFYVII